MIMILISIPSRNWNNVVVLVGAVEPRIYFMHDGMNQEEIADHQKDGDDDHYDSPHIPSHHFGSFIKKKHA